MSSWFAVDKAGLAKLLAKRGKAFAIYELVQNVWDTDSSKCSVKLTKVAGSPQAILTVEDDHPDGFTDLSHAYTLFAESEKKGDPTKRGRFNLGEKLVLALCRSASVTSTKGTVDFSSDGTRTTRRQKREAGTEFNAVIKMTGPEYTEVCQDIHKLIPPIPTFFNDQQIAMREPVAVFEASLPTMRSDDEGNLTRTVRKTEVRVYEPLDGEKASIYELGIPVVETGDKYHIDIQQKVPVNLDRDNVPPSYLRTIRALALNNTHQLLKEEDVSEQWVTDALHHKDIAKEAVCEVMDKRFGEERASYDPADKEANNRLVSKGYSIVHGGTFGKAAWANIREAGAILSSGTISPTPKPYSDDPDAPQVEVIPKDKWSDGMRNVHALTVWLGKMLLDTDVRVRFVTTHNSFSACYGNNGLDYNVRELGRKFFDLEGNLQDILDLILHEYAHHYEGNHLSDGYYHALSKLGAKMAVLVMQHGTGAFVVPLVFQS